MHPVLRMCIGIPIGYPRLFCGDNEDSDIDGRGGGDGNG